jgi:hypothetical protein
MTSDRGRCVDARPASSTGTDSDVHEPGSLRCIYCLGSGGSLLSGREWSQNVGTRELIPGVGEVMQQPFKAPLRATSYTEISRIYVCMHVCRSSQLGQL